MCQRKVQQIIKSIISYHPLQWSFSHLVERRRTKIPKSFLGCLWSSILFNILGLCLIPPDSVGSILIILDLDGFLWSNKNNFYKFWGKLMPTVQMFENEIMSMKWQDWIFWHAFAQSEEDRVRIRFGDFCARYRKKHFCAKYGKRLGTYVEGRCSGARPLPPPPASIASPPLLQCLPLLPPAFSPAFLPNFFLQLFLPLISFVFHLQF